MLATSATRKGLEIFLICKNHSATLVMKFDVESYVKLMSLRSRRASLFSSDLAALVKFFLFKNFAVVSVKVVNQLCGPSKSAQSLAMIFFVAFFTFCEAAQRGHCFLFFPGKLSHQTSANMSLIS